MNPPIGLWLPRFSPSAGNIRSPASSTPSPPPPGPWGATALHLPLPLLRAMPKEERAAFSSLGTSCHSIAEALEAQALGATYLLAGHIFDTSCKPGLPGRGLISWPRSAPLSPACLRHWRHHGGNSPGVRRAGARGACFRSGFMTCPDPASYLHTLERSFSHAISP